MSREREIRQTREEIQGDPHGYEVTGFRYVKDTGVLLSIIDEQRETMRDVRHLLVQELSIIDEQRAEMEQLRSEVRRWKQKYEMADTEW